MHRFEAGTSYPMHQTQTVDLIIIIAGEMELGLEQGATTVRQGDVIVQNRTQHSWRVVGDQPCVFVAVMVDATDAHRTVANPS
jgi:quercetin dioxygenase-like cupin family protein